MKKMMSLAAMCAVLAYASPASAELKLGGDASVRMRDVSYSGHDGATNLSSANDDAVWQYRVRLNASADLGSGYFFKALVMNEDGNNAGGWQSVSYANTEKINLAVSNFYFGRMQENCHWMVGRLPLGSFNNPIFDLTLFPSQPLETPVYNIVFDRVYGANYGTKIGDGMLNATFVVLDNNSKNDSAAKGNGLFNDGYALHLDYKVNVGDVTLEPEFLTVLTNSDIWQQTSGGLLSTTNVGGQTIGGTVVGGITVPNGYKSITPYSFGALVGVPAGKAKLTFGGFYTACNDTTPNSAPGTGGVDYNGYLFRVKGEYGNFMAWYDYNHTTDKSGSGSDVKYNNHFVWAQYKVPVYSSAAGSITLQPTLRYLAAKSETASVTNYDYQRLRSELWATVTF
jgi:hypothetical protein